MKHKQQLYTAVVQSVGYMQLTTVLQSIDVNLYPAINRITTHPNARAQPTEHWVSRLSVHECSLQA